MAQRFDSVQLSKTAKLDADGYLYDTPVLTLAEKVFTYHLPDGSVRREYRPATEVFNQDSLASFKGRPITVKHPAVGFVNTANIKDLTVGTILSEGRQDGDKVIADVVIHKPDEMSNKRELSLGYDLDLDYKKGVTAKGEHYDAIQTKIHINHLAIVDKGRAGRQARLNLDGDQLDELSQNKQLEKETQLMNEEIKIKGVAYNVPPQVAVELKEKNDLLEELQKQLTALQGDKETLESKITETQEAAKKSNQDAEDKFNAAVKERIKVLDCARKIKLDKADEMTDKEIKCAVIKALNKDSIDLKDKTDEYINVAFDFALAGLEKDNMKNQRITTNNDSLEKNKSTSAAQKRQDMIDEMKNNKGDKQ